MDIREQKAIDVHGHYGIYTQENAGIKNELMTGGPEVVVDRARRARVQVTVVSPLLGLMPRGKADAAAGNEEAATVVARWPELRQWVVVDPRQPQTFDQAREMLTQPWCVGIKVHPEEHEYPITEHGRSLFELAAELRTVIITHSGEERSLPSDFVQFANDFPTVRLILAHLGCGFDGDPGHQVRAVQSSRHGNVFVDTSSASGITANLLEWAVRQIGSDRILFGTDTPLYSAPMQRARIDHAEIADQDKRKILHDNAVRLLGL